MASTSYFITFICFTALLYTVSAIRCYSCDSTFNPACKDPFSGNGTSTFECNDFGSRESSIIEQLHNHFPGLADPKAKDSDFELDDVCFKIEYTTSIGLNTTLRTCSLYGEKSCELFSAAVTNNGGRVDFCQVCDDDLCNSATTTQLTIFSSFLLILSCYLIL